MVRLKSVLRRCPQTGWPQRYQRPALAATNSFEMPFRGPRRSSSENADLERDSSAQRGKPLNRDEPRSSAVAQSAIRLSVMSATIPPNKEGLWPSDWRCSRAR